jgi:hypothetical protein
MRNLEPLAANQFARKSVFILSSTAEAQASGREKYLLAIQVGLAAGL